MLEGFQDSRAIWPSYASSRTWATESSRTAIAELIHGAARTRSRVIRWKDIHESLEEAMNACEYAANVLEAIVVKNR